MTPTIDATERAVSREQLEDLADVARLALEEAERTAAAALAEFQQAMESDPGQVDLAEYAEAQRQWPGKVAQARLRADQAALKLTEFDLGGSSEALATAKAAVAAAEAAEREANKKLQVERGVYSRFHGRYQHLIEERRRLSEAITRHKSMIASIATPGSKGNTWRPRP